MKKSEEKKAKKILKARNVNEVYFFDGKYYLTKDKAPTGAECLKAAKPAKIK